MKVFFPIALFVPLLSDSGGVSAQTCSDLTAASVSSLGTFSEVNLLLCGSSTSTTVVKSPNALNWIVSEGSALAISMTPADFVIPIVKNGALYFDYNSESTWSGSGDVGIEITLPEGQVTRYSVVEDKWGVQFTLSSPVTIDVTGDYNTIYATSTAAVTLNVKGDYSTAQIDASGGGLLDVPGDSNTLEFKGAVSQASIVGDSNSILVEGAITGSSIEFMGDNNAFTLNGGSCDGADFTGDGNTCSSTTNNVTVGTLPCPVTASGSEEYTCTGSAGNCRCSSSGNVRVTARMTVAIVVVVCSFASFLL